MTLLLDLFKLKVHLQNIPPETKESSELRLKKSNSFKDRSNGYRKRMKNSLSSKSDCVKSEMQQKWKNALSNPK
jgi:hypothetical protein